MGDKCTGRTKRERKATATKQNKNKEEEKKKMMCVDFEDASSIISLFCLFCSLPSTAAGRGLAFQGHDLSGDRG